MKQEYKIREIQPEDDTAVEAVIRSCLIEFGANHEGTAWADLDLGRFSEIYCSEGNKYWVAVDSEGEIVGGACYLETLPNMIAAQRFYEKYGFVRIDEPLGDTGHFECDVRYIKEL